MARGAPLAVVETPDFVAAARRIMDEAERSSLVLFLAFNPEAGDLVPGTGGVRKLRWALAGRGKRGGARVIYYFHSERMPLFALDIYAKNERSDLSEDEKARLKQFVKTVARLGMEKRR
jgi:hypothetical protein